MQLDKVTILDYDIGALWHLKPFSYQSVNGIGSELCQGHVALWVQLCFLGYNPHTC